MADGVRTIFEALQSGGVQAPPLPPWATRLVPELERLEDAEARSTAWWLASRGCRRRFWLSRVAIWQMCVIVGGFTLIMLLGDLWGDPKGGWSIFLAFLLVAGCVLSSLVVHWLFRTRLRRNVWRLINEHGIPTCLECGYDLRGSEGPRCSECGAEIVPAAAVS